MGERGEKKRRKEFFEDTRKLCSVVFNFGHTHVESGVLVKKRFGLKLSVDGQIPVTILGLAGP